MGAAAPLPPLVPPPPEALSGPAHAQDRFFNPAQAAQSRRQLAREHGAMLATRFLIDQLEVGIGKGREAYSWDGQFWYGGNINKLWLKSEGEGEFGGSLEAAEIQGLWSRAINPWFDLQAGVRQDFGEGPDRTHLVVGIQGLARYWFEVDGALFLSNKGDLTGRIEAEYDLRLTQQLILQPRVEVDFSLQDIPELGTGAGLSTGEIGARLRYEFYPGSGAAVIAPYIGINYERAFGDTADFRRADGERRGDLRLLLGVRTWF
jgi:copper resistance protein B